MRDRVITMQQGKDDCINKFVYVLSYVLCCGIILSLFLFGERAKAVEFQTPDDIYNYYQLYTNDNFYNIVETISSECSYWSIWYDSISGEAGIVFTPNSNFNGFFWTANSNFINDYNYSNQPFVQNNDHYSNFMASMYTLYAGDMDFVSYGNYVQYWNTYIYSLHFKNGYIDIYRFWADRSDWHGWQTIGSSAGYYCVANVNRHREFYNISNATWNGYTSGHYLDSFRYDYSYSNYDGCIGFSRSSDRYGRQIIQNYTPPAQTEGLKVYKQSIHNREYLMIDFSDCVSWNLVPNDADIYISDASFNLNIDGTTHLFELDSEHYFTTKRDKEKAYWQIPLSQFNAFGLESANNVYVDNVHINYGFVAGMPMNYDIYYLDKVYLKGSADVVDGLEQPDDTEKVEYESYEDNSTIINQFNLALGQGGTHNYQYFYYGDAYSTRLLAEQSIEGVAEILYIDAQIVTDTGAGDQIYYYMGPNTYDKDNYKIDPLFINNEWALYCDCVIFDIYKDYAGALETADIRYYASVVYYTQRYYIRNGFISMSYSLKDIVEYSKKTEEYSYLIYSTLYDKLGNMDKNLYKFMISQIAHNSSVENALSNIYGSFDDLNDLIGRIIDILQDLHLDQLDTIDAKLTTIISNMGQSGGGSSSSSDWYRKYRTWLYDTGETTDNLIEPHEYFIKAFDDISGIYSVFDAFNFDSTDTGIYGNMKRFIKIMSGDLDSIDDNVSHFIFFGVNSDRYSVYSDNVFEMGGN